MADLEELLKLAKKDTKDITASDAKSSIEKWMCRAVDKGAKVKAESRYPMQSFQIFMYHLNIISASSGSYQG